MTLDDALATLGLGRDTSWPAIRSAYRTQIRTVHPDVAGAAGADASAAQLNAAFSILEKVYRRGMPAPPPPLPARSADPAPSWQDEGDLVLVEDDALALVAPADELFHRLADALDVIGALTYADPEAGYLEAVVAEGRGQLVVNLQGRAHATEALFTLEQLGAAQVPPLETLVRAVARLLHPTKG